MKRFGNECIRRILIALFFLTAASVLAAPPESVLSRLDAAVSLLQKSEVPVSYVSSTVFDMMDGSGKKLQTTEIRERVSLAPGREPMRETLYRKTTGEDKEARQAEPPKKNGEGGNGRNGMSMSMVFPTGKDADYFVFGDTGYTNGVASADFSPAPSARSKEGMTKGRLFWDPAAGNPVRLEAVPVQNPPFVTKLEMSFEFTGADDLIYPSRIEFNGAGGFLFFQRKFASETTITEVNRTW